MKIHQEITITSKDLDDESIIKKIEMFGRESPSWIFRPEKNAEYAKLCGVPSCFVVCNYKDTPKSSVHVTKRKNGLFFVPNIVPMEINELSREQYNYIALHFVTDLRAYLRKAHIGISILLSKQDIGIVDIIPGKLPRKFFDRYISLYPTSYHALDIQRLDQFICALVRYARTPMDCERLERLLVEDYKWQARDAEWCRTRIETGIDILKENRRL